MQFQNHLFGPVVYKQGRTIAFCIYNNRKQVDGKSCVISFLTAMTTMVKVTWKFNNIVLGEGGEEMLFL